MGTLNMNLEIDNKKIMVGNILSCILQKINLVKANNVKIEQNIATNLAPIASQYKKIKEFIKNKKAVIQPVVSKFFKKFNFSKLNLNDFKIDKKIQTHMQYLGLKTKSVVSDISKKLDTFVESTFNIDQTIETNMKPDASKYEEIGKYFERKAEVGKKTSY